jgi:signal transduction histidine kinase
LWSAGAAKLCSEKGAQRMARAHGWAGKSVARLLKSGGAYAVGAAVASVLLGLLLLSLWNGRSAVLDQARRDTQNLAGILEHDIAGKIRLIDYALWEMTGEIEAQLAPDKAPPLLAGATWLRERLDRLPGGSSIFVVDHTGRVTGATTVPGSQGIDVTDREYFKWTQANPRGGLHISAPYPGRAAPFGNETRPPWVVSFTRRINARDGAFAGSVSVSMRVDQITSTFARINAGRTGAISLWSGEFVLVARYPDAPDAIGQRRARFSPAVCRPDRPSTIETPSTPDILARIITCRAVEDYPLYLTVALGREEILAVWRSDAALYAAIALLCAAAVMALARYITRTHAADLGGAESRLRDAVESIGDAFVLFDRHDRLELWNDKFIEQFPFIQDLHPLADRTYEELLRAIAPHTADAQPDLEAYIQLCLGQHRNPPPEPVTIRMTDGQWFLNYERRTSSGGTVGIRTNITKLKRHEHHLEQLAENLKLAKLQAENANRAKSRFLAAMSHELRTPLNAVIGFSEIIKQQLLGPKAQDRYTAYAQDIYNSGVHLLDLINDVLDMSKIEAGRYDVIEEPIDVGEIIDACARMLQARATESGVAICQDLPPHLPLIMADRRAIKQVLLNLLTNAVKFTPSGGLVTIHARLDPSRALCVVVADTGCGIAANQLPHVFEPFRRAERDQPQSAHEGTGLGLAICKGLIDAHHGQIEIASTPGGGTSVTVTFPPSRTMKDARAVA